MRSRIAQLLLFTFLTANVPSTAFAQEDNFWEIMPSSIGALAESDGDDPSSEDLYESAEELSGDSAAYFEDPLASSALRNAYLLLKLQQYLQRAETNFADLEEKMDDTRTKIEENRFVIDTLGDEMAHLDLLITDTEAKIRNVTEQIGEKEFEISQLLKAIEFNEVQREDQKSKLEAYFQILYFEKNLYFDQNNEVNTLKILLQDGTTSNTLQRGTYIAFLEEHGQELMNDLEAIEREIARETYRVSEKRNQLASLNDQLDQEYRDLQAQKEGKANLLAETQGSDEVYRELFASYVIAQDAILEEINLFKTNIEALDERINSLSSQLTEKDLEQIQMIRSDSDLSFSVADAAAFLRLDWPVEPKKGLTAHFDDEDYTRTFGVPHHAVDIPTAHGSFIYAPSDGVVYKVYDAADLDDSKAQLGYGYLIIAHRKGVMTLYGHISSALVREGQYVKRGQIIGLTGGTPGTPGAGARTTGAHLHFEVFQDGLRVDPLEYLDLTVVPFDSIPEDFYALLEAQLQAQANGEVRTSVESDFESLEGQIQGLTEVEIEIKERDELNSAIDTVTQETINNNVLFETYGDSEVSDDYWTQGNELP